MRLLFVNLRLSNFKSFREEIALNLYPGAGLHFLKGRNDLDPRMGGNGVGKSSLFDGLCWCLFGRTPSGLRTPDIRPWNVREETTHADLILRREKQQHQISRSAAPNALTLDEKPITQEDLETWLGFSLPVFCHTILLGQAQPLFFDLSPKNKLELFTEILALERWTERSARADAVAKQLDAEAGVLREELAEVRGKIDTLEGTVARTKADADAWRAEQSKKIAVVRDTLRLKRMERDELQKTVDVEELRLDGTQTEIKPLSQAIDRAADDIAKVRAALLRINDEQRRLVDAANELKPGAVCPFCHQVMGKVTKNHKDKLLKDCALLDEKRRTAAKVLKESERRHQALQESWDLFNEKIDKAQTRLKMLIPNLAGLKAQIAELTKQESEADQTDNPHTNALADMKRQLKQLDETLDEKERDLKSVTRDYTRHKFWINGFKDLRLYLVEEVLQELCFTTNAMLTAVGLEGWTADYVIERESKSGSIMRGLTVLVRSPDTEQPVRWESWSGGEGQRLRLIGALSLGEVLLNRAGVEPSLEILDEPTRHLSGEGIRDLCTMLAARGARLGKAIFLVDHHALESRAFSSVVSVIKDSNGSHLG